LRKRLKLRLARRTHILRRNTLASKGVTAIKKRSLPVAHSILVIVYHLLERGEPYKELGGDYFIERQQKDAYQRRLVKQLQRMGYEVGLTKHAA
jgi:transposase